jgi:hypothetical protein
MFLRSKTHSFANAVIATAITTVALPAHASAAPQFSVVHQFTGSHTDGANPIDGMISDAAGNLYGVTFLGGKSPIPCLVDGSNFQCGTVFKLSPASAGQTQYRERPIHFFHGPDGFEPSTQLVADKSGALYGVTFSDSADLKNCTMLKGFECGVVYKLTPPAQGSSKWTESVLYRFSNVGAGFNGGYEPLGGMVIDSSGALIGTTHSGGTTNCFDSFAGCGVVFRLTPPTNGGTLWNETILYTFGSNGANDAGQPQGSIVADATGAIYGTTQLGGPNSVGTVWKLSPPGQGQSAWTETILHGFSGPDGSRPLGPVLIDANGAVYGNTIQGGRGTNCASGGFTCGVTYKLKPPAAGQTAWTETILHQFGKPGDGASPYFGLVADPIGNLFGITGNGPGNSGVLGTVFELSPPTGGSHKWTETLLHTFTGGSDGSTPSGALAWSNGALFGMAEAGGNFLGGTLFKIIP